MAFTAHQIAYLGSSVPGEDDHADTIDNLNDLLGLGLDDDPFTDGDTLLIAGDEEVGAVLWGSADEVVAHLRHLADEIEAVAK